MVEAVAVVKVGVVVVYVCVDVWVSVCVCVWMSMCVFVPGHGVEFSFSFEEGVVVGQSLRRYGEVGGVRSRQVMVIGVWRPLHHLLSTSPPPPRLHVVRRSLVHLTQ